MTYDKKNGFFNVLQHFFPPRDTRARRDNACRILVRRGMHQLDPGFKTVCCTVTVREYRHLYTRVSLTLKRLKHPS